MSLIETATLTGLNMAGAADAARDLFIDFAHWQGKMNHARAAARLRELNPSGRALGIMRVGSINNETGICYRDYQYDNNKAALDYYDEIGFYWYFRPNWPAKKQADYFHNLIEQAVGPLNELAWDSDVFGQFYIWRGKKIRIMCDFEEHGGLSPKGVTQAITGFVNCFFLYPIAYLRGWWWNDHTNFPEFSTEPIGYMALIIARYADLDHPWNDDPRTKPRDWSDWDGWQFSADGNGRGAEFGAESNSIDLSWVNGQLTPIEPDDPGGDDVTDLIPIVNTLHDLSEKFDDLLEIGSAILAALTAGEPPTPPDEPPASEYIQVRVTKDPRCNARYIKSYNAAGKPIMEIYPSASSPASERVQYAKGEYLAVFPDKIQADGGEYYYKLSPYEYNESVDLFVRQSDVMRA